jgi:phosphatidylglycerol---prolipoprotein diacylglyceryl transferase
MHPILINAFGLSIHSYGVLLAIGFMVGISLAAKEAVRTGVDPEKVLNLTFWILVSSIAGSRIFHCLVFYPQYLEDPLRIFKLWEGGLVFYGGFLGAILASVLYTRVHKMNFWQISDIMIPSVMLGLMFGRIGCFLAGCCFGKSCPADFPLGISFHNMLGLGVKGIPLYPTQPLSAANAFVIFLILWLYRKRKRFHGELLAITLILYPITRSLVEILRDDPRGFVNLGFCSLSESQVVSVAMLFVAAYILIRVRPAQPVPIGKDVSDRRRPSPEASRP